MKISIATPVLVGGDAVGNDVMGMGSSLQKLGHEVTYYALDSHVPFLPVLPITALGEKQTDIYIYHHSINFEVGIHFFENLQCRKIVKYHNITPSHFFSNPQIINECNKGREQLSVILRQKCEVWADSIYNGEELKRVNPNIEYKVIPPYNQVDMLYETTPDNVSVLPFDDWNTNIIMVGRVAPNKDILLGVEAFGQLQKRKPNCRLLIVGDAGGDYANQVRRRIADLGLQNKVFMLGKVPLSVLRACYHIGDALLITSKHEGFCVPMVEAMAFYLPVVTNRSCALSFTGGDAVHYTGENNPDDIAAGIEYVLRNNIHFIHAGRQRFLSIYKNSVIESNVLGAISKQ